MMVCRGIFSRIVCRYMTSTTAQEDSVKEMWTTYLEEVKAHDERRANSWKEDANSTIIFVSLIPTIPLILAMTNRKASLFSAIVAGFVIESYKNLSPDTGDQTILLLGQISQQLAGSTNNTNPNLPVNQPSSPSASTICVNVMWLLSLVLSLSSALFATLLQQWARKYIQKPQIPSLVSERARVHSFLYLGTQKYKMRLAVEIAPTLLHLSVFLFFAGLLVFFFPINKIVAIAVSISVGLFAVAYFTLTILPCIDPGCPYRTPMSKILWLIWRSSLSFVMLCSHWVARRIHRQSILGGPEATSPRQRHLVQWLEDAVKNQRDRLKKGFGKGIIQAALDAPVDVDLKALIRLFDLCARAGDKSKLPNLIASIPRDKLVEVVAPLIESGKIIFRDPLLTLLRNSAVGKHAFGLDKDVYKRTLLECLDAIHHIVKTFFVPDNVLQPVAWNLLVDMRTNFANISLMQVLWTDKDPATRVTSRSICALLARRLVRMRRDQFEESELDWLNKVTGEPSDAISNSFGNLPVLDRMILKSFVYGVFSHPEADFPTEHWSTTCFAETLAILINAGIPTAFHKNAFEAGLLDLIRWTDTDGQDGNLVASKLRSMFPNVLPDLS